MDEVTLFAMYYSAIAGWQFHPGYHKEDFVKRPQPLDLEKCAVMADHMVEITKERYPWVGSDQS